MDKLYFEGSILDLYSTDYQYLQDSINAEILKILKSIIDGELTSSIIKGFTLSIDPNDETKLTITHGGLTGSVISTDGIIIETDNELELIDLSDYTYGTINKVFIKCEQVYASYDRTTQEIIEGERKAIDLYNYELVYNRQVDKMSVVVYTEAEYNNLTQDEKDLLVLLGETTALGVGIPLTSVDTTGTTPFKLHIPDHLIDFINLSYSFMLPQRMVYPTSTGDVDDHLYTTPADLIGDLNEIRTQIRDIKATPHWNDYHSGVSGNDADMNELHRSGIFPNAYNTYDYALTSSGYAIIIDSGKALINRDIIENMVAFDPVAVTPGDAFYVGDYPTLTDPEQHVLPVIVYPQPYTFYLNYYPAVNLHIIDSDGSLLVEGVDYTFISSTGTITTILGGDMGNETVDCYYESGGYRCDLISLGETGLSYVEGTAVSTKNPVPPLLTSTGMIPLYYLYRHPRQDYIEDSDVVSGRFYVFPVKEIRELGYEDLASYDGVVFDELNTSASHKMTFFATSSGMSIAKGIAWDVAQTPAGLGINMDTTVYMQTYLYTRPLDQFWLLVESTHEGSIHTGPTSEVLTVKLEYETTPDSGVLDGIVYKTISPKIYSTSSGILPVLVTSTGFQEGVTKMRLSITSGTQLTFWKILIGQTDLYYINNFIDFVWNSFNELYIDTNEHRKHLEYLDDQADSLRDRISKTEILNIEQEVRLNAILGRNTTNSNLISDIFVDLTNTDKTLLEQHNAIVDIMDDISFGNNWKDINNISDMQYKSGFARPRKYPYPLEIIDEYNLDGVGQIYKSGIVYDDSEQCYWMISNAGTNAIGEITKLGKYLIKGKVEVMGRWFLPATTNAHWIGITVDSSNKKLYFVKWLLGTGVVGSTIYGLDINTDKSLGVTAYKKYSGEAITPGSTTFAQYSDTTSGAGISDVVVYNSTELGYLLGATSGTVWELKFRKLSDLGAGTTTTITGLDTWIGLTGDLHGRSMVKSEDTLYIKINNITTTAKRLVFKFNLLTDIVSSVARRCSGRFVPGRDVARESVYANEGICISANGDILEQCSTASNGRLMLRRALQGALWAENQVCGEDPMYHVSAAFPTVPYACMVDSNGWIYTAHTGVTAGTVYIYRYKPEGDSSSPKRCLVSGTVNCTAIIDMATDGTNVMLITLAGSTYSVYKGTLAALTTALDALTSITVPDATWTLVSGSDDTNAKNGICYDVDNDVFYMVNDGTDSIATITPAGSYTNPVFDLPTPPLGGNWTGIAYKNENIYLGNASLATSPCKIYVLPLGKQSAALWYKAHIHQDPSLSFVAAGMKCMDFKDNDLVIANATSLNFLTMKVLEDPNVLQLHSFIDSDNATLSNNITRCTQINERYFEPHEFFDRRDCPNKFYIIVGYGDEGLSELHLDEFLFGKTATGQDRYDVSKIICRHYSSGANNVIPASATCSSLSVEKDMIFYGSSLGAVHIIDLKSGKAWYLSTTSGANSGYYYNSALSHRNEAAGYTGSYSVDLTLGTGVINKFSARTFMLTDTSDYNYVNPRTYVAMGTNATGVDLLEIAWDSNGNRTPVKVYNNVLTPASSIIHAVYIAPSGKLFAGTYDAVGYIYKQTSGNVWDITTDSWGGTALALGTSTFTGYVMDIAPNSVCYKSQSGAWFHRLYVSYADKGVSVYNGGVKIIDVETLSNEAVYFHQTYTGASVSAFDNCDVFEDICAVPMYSANATDAGLIIARKLYFQDVFPVTVSPGNGGFRTNWTSIFPKSVINNTTSPSFYRYTTASNLTRSCKFSADTFKTLCCTTDLGLQLFHIPYFNNCIQRTNVVTISNPESYVYRQHKLSGYGD